jgi:hypothetical protein
MGPCDARHIGKVTPITGDPVTNVTLGLVTGVTAQLCRSEQYSRSTYEFE